MAQHLGAALTELPSGKVTLLFSDIEGSTRLLLQLGDHYAEVLEEHRRVLRTAFQRHGGSEVDTQGDAFFVVFGRATDAVAAAIQAQLALAEHPWPDRADVRVRMALHTGEPTRAGGGYVGLDVHRAARLCAAGHGGQVLASQATRAIVENELPDGVSLRDLGEHCLKDLPHPERVCQLVVIGLPADFPPLRSLDTLLHNLPSQLTRFIGREREMAAVERMLSTERLVTLVGPGGAGKTRLALQVAADQVERSADGVWLVELASLADPELVPQTVASSLGVREEPGRPLLAALLAAVGPKHLLLVLDNCEHLTQACAELAHALLRASPSLRILATSREALGIAGEATWTIPPLSLPDPEQLPPPERLTRYEAVQLFIDRALLAAPKFAVTNENAPAVAQICRRLDGIPLAIEMAAARTRALSVEQIARRLDDRFRLLTGGSRASPPRQQTLRALVDWSYDLLVEEERSLFGRLSVFSGGWSLEATEAVCAGDGIEPGDVLDLLARLADKSLVVVEPGADGSARYRLLEILGQYGRERLVAHGEVEAVRSRHAAFFLDLAERAAPELYGPRQSAWYRELQREHDNLRAALRWYLERGAMEALRLAGALWWFWHQHQLWTEGRDWLERALALPEASHLSLTRAEALLGAGLMAAFQRDFAAARARLEESAGLARELPTERTRGRALGYLGIVSAFQGDHAAGQILFEESLGIARAQGDLWNQSTMLRMLAMGAVGRQDHAAAGTLLEDSLVTARASGDTWNVAMVLNACGDLTRAQGDYARAGTFYEESLTLLRERGVGGAFGGVLHNLGYVALRRGDLRGARECFAESLAAFRKMGDQRGMAECLTGLAGVLGAQAQTEQAIKLYGAAEATFEALGTSPSPHNQSETDRSVSTARASIDDAKFAVAWVEGRAMSLEQAIASALAAPVIT